jgi:hypothetical protein
MERQERERSNDSGLASRKYYKKFSRKYELMRK